MVKTVRAWPEYHQLLGILQEKFVDVEHIIELLREISWRGNVVMLSMTENITGIPLVFCSEA
jgi:hypothetical protein